LRSFEDYENMAMLDLSDSERSLLQKRFEEITDCFSDLDKIVTNDAEPLVTVLDVHNIMREDVAFKAISADELEKSSSERHDGYFQVPATID